MNAIAPSLTGIHLMAKPIGALCNLDCGYCFYLEKENAFPPRERFRMSDEVLDTYVQRYIAAAQSAPEVEFTWQGGEPTLLGLAFFEHAVVLQRKYAKGKPIRNTLQTNGTLLDDAWCVFLKRERFLVGVSLDGPRALNDVARPDKRGRSSYDATVRGLASLSSHGVDFNVLVTVSSANVHQPLEIYRHLKELGAGFIQFNPVVERMAEPAEAVIGLHFAVPPRLSQSVASKARPTVKTDVTVTSHTVNAEAYGTFLSAVFDEWVRHDVGSVHVMNFEWALASWCQLPAGACIFSPRCGKAAIVEHDGSVYSCDHFMYPEYRLGNLASDDLTTMMSSRAQTDFGMAKETSLPDECLRCEFRFACHGECPKNRFIESADGEAGLNYLCAGYKAYFRHITPAMNVMARLLGQGKPADEVMDMVQC
ncbi:anaerobic sulfatase maturase [Paraburkholderia saeva]|uniref:anaerobic sulfatase maturase n=1 Tax=Paraburkholderia saeva TaxID=2777537 RepID=UPI001E05EE03|nr:anaerobic sulfatase maturase [Paraburkholderia saeva]CAG4917207.1 Anaerobic sulfatase-maturating enzyme [Paraburkholderia saeva]